MKSIPIGRVFGIKFFVNPTWLVIFALITWTLISGYFPQAYPDWSVAERVSTGIIASLLFFSSVLIHELAHSMVSLKQGVPVKSITLFIFGGMAEIAEEPKKAWHEFLMALAGPLASFSIGALLFGLTIILNDSSGVGEYARAVALWLGPINIYLGIFNLIPGFPLDGGRVLRSIIWWRTGKLNLSTKISSIVGRVFGYGFILLGILFVVFIDLFNGIWLALIGWFLVDLATNSYRQVQLLDLLVLHKVREAMVICGVEIPSNISVEQLYYDYVLKYGHQCFPVMRDGQLIGFVDASRLRQVPHVPATTSSPLPVVPFESTQSVMHDDDLAKAFAIMTESGMPNVPVVQNGRMVGVVNSEGIQSLVNLYTGNRK